MPMRARRATPPEAQRGRLGSRPTTQPRAAAPAGLQPMGPEAARDGLLYVPPACRPDRPAPLVVALHGAGGDAEDGLFPLQPLADEGAFILLAPASADSTWDIILGRFGPDVLAIDRLLERVFERHAVDPSRLAISGFSDGASYALSLGLANGDLFTHVIAFSPGFVAAPDRHGMPRLFVSHGTDDRVLPIARCSRVIVPQLRRAGYDLEYREFDGGHTIPAAVSRAAVRWFAGEAAGEGDRG